MVAPLAVAVAPIVISPLVSLLVTSLAVASLVISPLVISLLVISSLVVSPLEGEMIAVSDGTFRPTPNPQNLDMNPANDPRIPEMWVRGWVWCVN